MRKKILLSTIGLACLASQVSVAQTALISSCLSDKYNQQLEAENPQLKTNKAAMEAQIQQYISQHQNLRQASGTVIQIPVVIHVVTERGCDGISKAQILNGLETLNKDFRRQNADTVNTRAIFRSVAADTEIEFVLARKDPVGWQTEGINRVSSSTTKGSVNRDDVKIAAPAWPTDKYFNIWLVDNIYDSQVGANVLGYAYFPTVLASIPNKFGVVLAHTAWGKQGAVTGSTANTNGHYATHEISHCLNLSHIVDGDIINGVVQCTLPNGACGFGDGVLDTPPSYPTTVSTTCDFTLNTCHNDVTCSSFTTDMPDMIENFQYMSDDNCQNMFTNGQKTRMHDALLFYPQLQNLVSPANAAFTGISQGFLPTTGIPMPYFCANKRVCAGGSITFTDQTYNAPATVYDWTFTGGTPATSSAQNPVITYNTPGKYSVTLQTTNPEGMRVVTMTDYVTVVPISNLINISPPGGFLEEFNESTFPVSATSNRTWEMATSSIGSTTPNWTRVNNAYSNAYGTGTNSLKLQNANIPAGTFSTLLTPNFSLQGGAPSFVGVEIAYAKRTAQPSEMLKAFYSHDCGVTWNGPIKTLTGNQLITNNGAQISNFVPTAAEWRMESIIQGGSPVFSNVSHIMFKIEVTSNGGGNLYLDNFIIGSVLGTKETENAQNIQLFPNPLTAETGINFTLNKAEKGSVKIFDLIGNVIYSGPETTFSAGKHTVLLADKLKNQSAGLYLVQLNLEGKIYNTKLLVQ